MLIHGLSHGGVVTAQVGQERRIIRGAHEAQQLALGVGDHEGIHLGKAHPLHRLAQVQFRRAADGTVDHNVSCLDELRRRPDTVLAYELSYELVAGIFQELFRLIVLQDLALVHDADLVGDLHRLVHVVGDENNGLVQLLL